jgi:hypothetical protein
LPAGLAVLTPTTPSINFKGRKARQIFPDYRKEKDVLKI